MCEYHVHRGYETINEAKKYRLVDFFERHWDKYMESPTEYVKPEQLKAVNAMRVCRTAVLGIDEYACPDCGEITRVYHSCKNRFCPTCSWQDTVRWAEKVKRNMLWIKHRHVVCTLPHSLHPIIKKNQKKLLSALMRASAHTFQEWFECKYRLQIGIILVMHSGGEQKEYHPHTHMIVSWGGIHKETGKLVEIKDEYVNYKFLQKKFRCKFEDELIKMNDAGELKHDFNDRHDFMRFIKSVNQNDWILHLEPAIQTPEEVIRYIGRYSKRACLSDHKITSIEGESITFRHKDYRDRDERNKAKEKELTLHYRDFFPMLLQHVPEPYFRIVRYYGLYSNKGFIPEEYKKPGTENQKQSWSDIQELKTGENPMYCSHCHKRKIYIHTLLDTRSKEERQIGIQTINTFLKIKRKRAA
ncbi:MAG: transposase [Firmicutes bacterium]|nr:transposase [Bacillota bacterium]